MIDMVSALMLVSFIIRVINFLPRSQVFPTQAISSSPTRRLILALEELGKSIGNQFHFLFICTKVLIISTYLHFSLLLSLPLVEAMLIPFLAIVELF